MKRKSKNLIAGFALAAAVFATSARADDTGTYLEPDLSWSADDPELRHVSLVHHMFARAFAPDVRVRVLALGINLPFMTGVASDGRTYRVFHLAGPRYVESETEAKDVKLCQTPIDSALAKRIIELWRKLLLQTRYSDKPRIGLDGTDYLFEMGRYSVPMIGHIWSPPEKSKTGLLTQVAEDMVGLCESSSSSAKPHLEADVAVLEQRLKDEK